MRLSKRSVATTILLVFSFTLSACKEDLNYKLLFAQGAIKGISIPSEKKADENYYKEVINRECRRGELCILHFFHEIDRVSLPFSDEELAKRTAAYNRNPHTGLDRLLIECGLGDFSPDNCLAND